MRRIFRKLRLILLTGGLFGFGAWFFFRTAFTVSTPEALKRGEELFRFKRVLVVAAHPDDVEWYMAGTLRRYAHLGAEVYVIIASNGEKGPNQVNSPDLAKTRQEEQLKAARILGYKQVFFLGLPDRGVTNDRAKVQSKIDEVWRKMKPEIVFTWDPSLWRLPYLHPDHESLGGVVEEYWRTLPAPRPALYFFHSRRPDTAVDITQVQEDKWKALQAHRSQGIGSGAVQFNARTSRGSEGRILETLREARE